MTMCRQNGRWDGAIALGTIQAVRDKFRHLVIIGCLAMVRRADRKLADAEREGLFEELRKWIRKEQR
jgi:hypothetical protein